MVEVNDSGLFIIEGDEVTHVHTSSASDTDMEQLNEYLEEWSLTLDD